MRLFAISLLPSLVYSGFLLDTFESFFDVSERIEQFADVPPFAQNAWRMVAESVPEGQQKLEMGIRGATKLKAPPVTARNHSLRIHDPSKLDMDETKQWSGYLDISDGKHLFFWFFEARNDPENAPFVLWTNGGPGCSSSMGQFFELGPSFIGPDLKPIRNPYSWNTNANIVFLDQPAGTGYSWQESDKPWSTKEAAEDVYKFLDLFFTEFPEYLGRDVHLAGESYAGVYLPEFAHAIAQKSDRSFNMTSLLCGNGITDSLKQFDMFWAMGCGLGDNEPIFNETVCQSMLDAQPTCDALIAGCYLLDNPFICVPAKVYCEYKMLDPFEETGRNIYDITKQCDGDLCYPGIDLVQEYLHLESVKNAVGVDPEAGNFSSCDSGIASRFLLTGDEMRPHVFKVIELLDNEYEGPSGVSEGIPQLYYAGDLDFICNYMGVNRWTSELDWSGHESFSSTPLTDWRLSNGTVAGNKRNYGKFTYLRIFDAGHMVPHDKGKAALEMLNTWISGDYALNGQNATHIKKL